MSQMASKDIEHMRYEPRTLYFTEIRLARYLTNSIHVISGKSIHLRLYIQLFVK